MFFFAVRYFKNVFSLYFSKFELKKQVCHLKNLNCDSLTLIILGGGGEQIEPCDAKTNEKCLLL